MESKVVEAGKPIEIKIEPSLGGAGGRTLSLTILEEISAGSDRRVYKVKDQHGNLYAYKYMKKRTLKKEIERTDTLSKAGVPYATMVASGRDLEERGVGYTVREWIEGVRGDEWLRSWESFGAPMQADGVADLVLLLDTLLRKGLYVGKLDPEDMIFCPALPGLDPPKAGWVIVDCGSVKHDVALLEAADRYFWKFIERWGAKLNRHHPSFVKLFMLLVPLGKDFAAPTARQADGTSPEQVVAAIARLEDDPAYGGTGDDEDDDEDEDEDETDGESEIPSSLVVMDRRSAYPGTPFQEGGFRDGSYELLKDGTERINGRVVSPSASDLTVTVGDETLEYGLNPKDDVHQGSDAPKAFSGGRYAPAGETSNARYGKSGGESLTKSEESATSTDEDPTFGETVSSPESNNPDGVGRTESE